MSTTSATEKEEKIYKVQVPRNEHDNDDTTQTIIYIIRGLKESEITKWTEFCANVFAYKSNPPSSEYFYRHYINDPYHYISNTAANSSYVVPTPSLIRVAVYQDEIVSSCRIFLRDISIPDKSSINSKGILKAGGIGEVCTSQMHQRRGLSTALLRNAIQIMKERQLHVSLLHAGPSFFPFYQKFGYTCSQTNWTVVKLNMIDLKTKLPATNDDGTEYSYIIRQAMFPNVSTQLHKLHQQYSEQRLCGCIVRSQQYWNQYLSDELQGSLFVFEAIKNDADSESNNRRIVAWLSIRPRGDMYQLREFGLDLSFLKQDSVISPAEALRLLLAHAFQQYNQFEEEQQNELTIPSSLPQFVANDIRQLSSNDNPREDDTMSFIGWKSEQVETDEGWMYLSLDDDPNKTVNFVNGTNSINPPHFIWPSDSF